MNFSDDSVLQVSHVSDKMKQKHPKEPSKSKWVINGERTIKKMSARGEKSQVNSSSEWIKNWGKNRWRRRVIIFVKLWLRTNGKKLSVSSRVEIWVYNHPYNKLMQTEENKEISFEQEMFDDCLLDQLLRSEEKKESFNLVESFTSSGVQAKKVAGRGKGRPKGERNSKNS